MKLVILSSLLTLMSLSVGAFEVSKTSGSSFTGCCTECEKKNPNYVCGANRGFGKDVLSRTSSPKSNGNNKGSHGFVQ